MGQTELSHEVNLYSSDRRFDQRSHPDFCDKGDRTIPLLKFGRSGFPKRKVDLERRLLVKTSKRAKTASEICPNRFDR